jgi:hypothetical protein
MRFTRSSIRFATSLMMLSALGASGCAADQSDRKETSESPAVPAPPADFKPPVQRPLPGKVEVRVGWIPDGYVETKGQVSLFTLNRPPGQNEAPGLVRTWIREDGWTKDKGGQPSLIGIIVEPSEFENPMVNPRQIAIDGKVLQAVQGTTEVLMRVQSTGARDIRWTESGLDVKILLSGAEWDDFSTKRLVSSVRLIRK